MLVDGATLVFLFSFSFIQFYRSMFPVKDIMVSKDLTTENDKKMQKINNILKAKQTFKE